MICRGSSTYTKESDRPTRFYLKFFVFRDVTPLNFCGQCNLTLSLPFVHYCFANVLPFRVFPFVTIPLTNQSHSLDHLRTDLSGYRLTLFLSSSHSYSLHHLSGDHVYCCPHVSYETSQRHIFRCLLASYGFFIPVGGVALADNRSISPLALSIIV